MPVEKKCHYCQATKGPWAVWRRAPSERGEGHEQILGSGLFGRRHRLCKQCHEAMMALAALSKEKGKNG